VGGADGETVECIAIAFEISWRPMNSTWDRLSMCARVLHACLVPADGASDGQRTMSYTIGTATGAFALEQGSAQSARGTTHNSQWKDLMSPSIRMILVPCSPCSQSSVPVSAFYRNFSTSRQRSLLFRVRGPTQASP
jgi:hypothetical protein